jgi:hypothetical protein
VSERPVILSRPNGDARKALAAYAAEASKGYDAPDAYDRIVAKVVRRAKSLGLAETDAYDALGLTLPVFSDEPEVVASGPAVTVPPPSAASPKKDTTPKDKSRVGKQSFVQKWRWAVMSVSGPAASNTRWVLVAISQFADPDGTNCYPGLGRICTATRLSRWAVKTHIKIAVREGWLVQRLVPRRHGNMTGYEYTLRFPKAWRGEAES